mgnify:CR=1 FL=1
MKHLQRFAGILTAFCLMIILFFTSVEAVVYWNPGYFEKEYTKYQVLEDLPEMTMEDLLAVTDEMIDYLRGDRDDLHVFTTMGGEYREFFNAREIAHMEDVRGLFLGGLTIRRTAFCILIACAVFLINIVPEPFFMDTAFRILAVFCGSTALIFLICLFLWRKQRKTAFTCPQK